VQLAPPLVVPLLAPEVPLAPELDVPLDPAPPAQRNALHGRVQHSSSSVHEAPGARHGVIGT
jgi:hypothetical protein